MFTTADSLPLCTKPTSVPVRLGLFVALLALASVAVSASGDNACHCAVNVTDAPMVEWDLPSVVDTSSGGITVDVHANSHKGRIWFVSRQGDVKLYRFEPGIPLATKLANWKSYDLNPLSLTTGGVHRIKVHRNDHWVYVRTHTSLQRVDTTDCDALMQTCKRVTWFDQLGDFGPDVVPHVSDLSVDDCNVYTTTAVFDSATGSVVDPGLSYLQQLSPCRNTPTDATSGTTQVKRWQVGGSAGFCPTETENSPCISGVAVDQRYSNLVYFSQPGNDMLGELNVNTNGIRRWNIGAFGAHEPRQIDVDNDGMVWVVTGSGHLVRLDPRRNKVSVHAMPAGALADPFGVAPDHGAVGYTKSAFDQSRVGMLLPKPVWQSITPTLGSIPPTSVTLNYVVENAMTVAGTTPPQAKMAIADTTVQPDGTYVEASVGAPDNTSFNPLGIAPDFGRRVGSYFYTVGVNMENGMNRIGHIQLPFNRQGHGYARDDDDHDGVHHGNGDDDDDGVKDGDDDDTKHEQRDTRNDEVAASQSVDYPMEVEPGTLLMTAVLTANNLGTMVSVEVYNPAGQLVAAPLPAPGVLAATVPTTTAGTYTVRVKNLGITPMGFTTSFLFQSAWPVLPDLP